MQVDAARLVRSLESKQLRVVFAESCTGGMISAELAKIPGVSDWLCGSAVTYRYDTKSRWLGVRRDDLERFTAVSSQVANQMAAGVLEQTPEAHISASVTGHLGPNAPPEQDGLVFSSIARRNENSAEIIVNHRFILESTEREDRQQEATRLVLQALLSVLNESGSE